MFQHAFMTFPKYVTRELGEAYPFGKVWAINPIMIIFLVPVVTVLTRHRSAFSCIVAGAMVSALSPFVLCLGASSKTVIAMVVVLSLGEALWSPRVYEYAAMIAPRGRESSYMGLSYLPLFVAKIIVGPLSGFLLARYVPPDPPRSSETMWLIIGLMTLAGPLLLLFLRGTIEADAKKPAPRAPEEAPA
jgi:MFS family permease